jgi:hypothetical protein
MAGAFPHRVQSRLPIFELNHRTEIKVPPMEIVPRSCDEESTPEYQIVKTKTTPQI